MALSSRLAERAMSLPPARDRAVAVEHDVRVPMDDGVTLMADVYTPAGAGPHPTVLVRSPYGRRGPLGFFFGRAFAERGYRVVMQSCRGTFGSGGVFHPNFGERADGLATIRWIERQAWFDGRLTMNGPSYMGAVQWAVADTAGPSLRALCTHVTYSNITKYWYRGGSFALGDALDWATMVSEQEDGGRLGGLAFMLELRWRRIQRVLNDLPIANLDERVMGRRVPFWREFVEHPSSEDPFWNAIDHSARVAAVTAPVLQVGGWYDIFLPVQLEDHRALVAAGRHPRLVIGPWTHASSKGFGAQITESLRWLDRHTAAAPTAPVEPNPVRVFVMGAGVWRDVASWPPPDYAPQRWHLYARGRIGPAPQAENGCERYVYDPADPTPIVGGTLLQRSGGRRAQTRTERRPDVLVFTSDVLTSDVDVIGEVTAEIHVSSDLEHFDVFVRLCDVDAKGTSFNVCDGIERVSPAHPARRPDGVWVVPVSLWATAQRFVAGHRIRIQVSSGAHPRFVRHLGTDEPIGGATTMRVAHQVVHYGPDHPSAITLPIKALP